MLTSEAQRERMWGHFPALRWLLENRPGSDRRYGPTSVSDNVFDVIHRHVQIAASAEENRDELLRAAQGDTEFARALWEDLRDLQKTLESLRNAFEREIREIERLGDEIRVRADGQSSSELSASELTESEKTYLQILSDWLHEKHPPQVRLHGMQQIIHLMQQSTSRWKEIYRMAAKDSRKPGSVLAPPLSLFPEREKDKISI